MVGHVYRPFVVFVGLQGCAGRGDGGGGGRELICILHATCARHYAAAMLCKTQAAEAVLVLLPSSSLHGADCPSLLSPAKSHLPFEGGNQPVNNAGLRCAACCIVECGAEASSHLMRGHLDRPRAQGQSARRSLALQVMAGC